MGTFVALLQACGSADEEAGPSDVLGTGGLPGTGGSVTAPTGGSSGSTPGSGGGGLAGSPASAGAAGMSSGGVANGSGGESSGSGGEPVGGGGLPAGTGGATEGSGGMMGGSGGVIEDPLDVFSFFVTSLRAMQELSGSQAGFGGDLRFGETGPGAGLKGADKICSTIAERSMPGSSVKQWRAFLSATAGEDGQQVNAIDRIGDGPWYDRLGRLVAQTKADLLHDRPMGADPVIIDDLPNEDGVPNHAPDPGQGQVDNHDILTGTNDQGQLYGPTATCMDWTAKQGNPATEGTPRVGHSWPRAGFGVPPGFPPGGPGGGFGGFNPANWMSSLDEAGCAPGVNLIEMGPPNPLNPTVGSGGGYGGIYCFALEP